MTFPPGANDIYGLDGLVFVQIITFFSVAYLIVRAMLERLDPSMEEAAHSLGAGKFHIFRTVTLPLLIPGIAGSFLLLFVESLADLGNPLFISGNVTVLSAQIFLAVAGEYDYQKASALALVLLHPHPGRVPGAALLRHSPLLRLGDRQADRRPDHGKGGVDPLAVHHHHLPDVRADHRCSIWPSSAARSAPPGAWITRQRCGGGSQTVTRGIESILDTTFLSAFATPIAALTGMVIAFLVVRKRFSGKESARLRLEPGRRRARHDPGHRLRAGVQHPADGSWSASCMPCWRSSWRGQRFTTGAISGSRCLSAPALGVGLAATVQRLDARAACIYLLGGIYVGLGLLLWLWQQAQRRMGWLLIGMGVYLFTVRSESSMSPSRSPT